MWVFDQSSCHRSVVEDALNARGMNVLARWWFTASNAGYDVGKEGSENGDGGWYSKGNEDGVRGKGNKHENYEWRRYEGRFGQPQQFINEKTIVEHFIESHAWTHSLFPAQVPRANSTLLSGFGGR